MVIKYKREKKKNAGKGVKQTVVKNEITFVQYKTCLFTQKDQMRKIYVIRSHKHEVYTEEINKVAQSADDKWVVLNDKRHSLALGHYRLEKN